MKYLIFVVTASLTILFSGNIAYSINCMWDNSCPDAKFDIDYCGNGYCDTFETKEICLEDCGSVLDQLIEKFSSDDVGDDYDRGPFTWIHKSNFTLMTALLTITIIIVVLAIIFIAIHDRVIGGIERSSAAY